MANAWRNWQSWPDHHLHPRVSGVGCGRGTVGQTSPGKRGRSGSAFFTLSMGEYQREINCSENDLARLGETPTIEVLYSVDEPPHAHFDTRNYPERDYPLLGRPTLPLLYPADLLAWRPTAEVPTLWPDLFLHRLVNQVDSLHYFGGLPWAGDPAGGILQHSRSHLTEQLHQLHEPTPIGATPEIFELLAFTGQLVGQNLDAASIPWLTFETHADRPSYDPPPPAHLVCRADELPLEAITALHFGRPYVVLAQFTTVPEAMWDPWQGYTADVVRLRGCQLLGLRANDPFTGLRDPEGAWIVGEVATWQAGLRRLDALCGGILGIAPASEAAAKA